MFYQFVKMKFLMSATLLCSIIAINLREGNLIIHISQLVVKFTTGFLIDIFYNSFTIICKILKRILSFLSRSKMEIRRIPTKSEASFSPQKSFKSFKINYFHSLGTVLFPLLPIVKKDWFLSRLSSMKKEPNSYLFKKNALFLLAGQ